MSTPRRTLTWLHLSDLHICDSRYPGSKRIRAKLCDDLSCMQREFELSPDFLFFTGDMAYGHLGDQPGFRLADQFQEARHFFDQVRESFQPTIPLERFFLVPGNHDVNRQMITADQTWWIETAATEPDITAMISRPGLQWRRWIERLDDYKDFLLQYGCHHLLTDPDRLIYQAKFDIGGISLGIAGFNSAWSCAQDNEKGRLRLAGSWQAGKLWDPLEDTDLRIALIHHPTSWFHPQEDPSILLRIIQDFDFCLHGHEHEGWVFESTDHVRIAADAAHDRANEKTRDNGYNFVRLDLETGEGEVWLRCYDPVGTGWIPKAIAGHADNLGRWPLRTFTSLKKVLEDRRPSDSRAQAAVIDHRPVGLARQTAATAVETTSPKEDWGQVPETASFYGRAEDRQVCKTWIESESCKLLGIFGAGGIGKTQLAAKIATDLSSRFEFVFWRSLTNTRAPLLPELLQECLLLVSGQQELESATPLDRLFLLLGNHLRRSKCLIVLDNFDTVLEPGDDAGRYREGYESYGQLITQLGSTPHRSCLIMTSRELPKEFTILEGCDSPVRARSLAGLGIGDAREMLHSKQLDGSDDDWKNLVQQYSGNPFLLKLVSETIRSVYGGSIARFLASGEAFSGDVTSNLEHQIDRLTQLEREICRWLAIEGEGASIEDLEHDLLATRRRSMARGEVQEALSSLRRRSLLEAGGERFKLANVVVEFLTRKLIDGVCDEIVSGAPVLLEWHALLKSQDRDYSREAQARLILKPIADRLIERLGKDTLSRALASLLDRCRDTPSHGSGYVGGNVINLLAQAGIDLHGWDFSGLTICQAYLRGVELHSVDFSSCDLSRSSFTEVLSAVHSVSVSPDGRYLAAGDLTGEVSVWDIADGRKALSLSGHVGVVWSICFAAEGRLLATCGHDKTIRLWDLEARQCRVLTGHTSWVSSIAFSPDGALLASASGDRTARLWAVETGECLTSHEGHSHSLHAVRFRAIDRVLATASSDGTVCLWDAADSKDLRLLTSFRAHDEPVLALSFSPDGQLLATGGGDKLLKVWHLGDLSAPRLLYEPGSHAGEISSVAFGADRTVLASGSHDHTVKIWALPEQGAPECLSTLLGHSSAVHSIAFSPDGTLVSGGNDLTVRRWNVDTGQCLASLQGHTSWIHAVAISQDGTTLATGSNDRVVRLWDLAHGHCRAILREHADQVTAVAMAISADREVLASGCADGVIRLWDVKTGQLLFPFVGHASGVRSIAISREGDLLVSCGVDHTLRVWDIRSGKRRLELRERFDLASSVAINHAGDLVAATCADYGVRLWDARTGEMRKVLIGHTEPAQGVAFSPAADLVASGGSDGSIKLWDVGTGLCRATLEGHSNRVTSVTFSPDGRTLASGSYDMTVRLWDLQAGTCRILDGHRHWVHAIAFGASGSILVSGGADETAKLWDLELGAVSAEFRNPKLYEGMKIWGARGITDAQRASLRSLGAIGDPGEPQS